MSTVMTTVAARASDRAGSPSPTRHPATGQPRMIPMEQYSDGTGYVIRLEIPGVDPARDLSVSVETGTLSVRAERRSARTDQVQTEFHYGSLARDVALPLGSNVDDVTASCRDGILTVRIGMQPEHQGARRVKVGIEPGGR